MQGDSKPTDPQEMCKKYRTQILGAIQELNEVVDKESVESSDIEKLQGHCVILTRALQSFQLYFQEWKKKVYRDERDAEIVAQSTNPSP